MRKITLLIIALLAVTTVTLAQNQTINGNLHVSNTSGGNLRIGKIGDAGNKAVPVGGLAARYNLDFSGYRDVAADQIGARIAALRFNRHLANSALVQKTGLAFYTNPLGMNTGATDLVERMRITPEGNIGIGTAAPQYKLHVEGDIYSKNWVRVNGNQGLYFQSWGGGFYMLDANWIRTYGNKGFYHNTGIMRTDGIFHVGPDGNRLIVNTNGNVGIGTTNPRALLDIGNLSRNKLKSVLARSDEGNNDGEGTYLGVKTYNTQPVSGESYSNVKSFALEHKFYGQLNNSINFYRGSGYTGGSISLAVDNGKEIARFHSTGLNLAGTINARQVNITVSAGADHVFYPDYALMPLSEVESFVKENKHLPEIPSEKQMVEEGLNVNEMQIKLLQKIEELTLYVIEQDKKIEKQNRIIQELQNRQNN